MGVECVILTADITAAACRHGDATTRALPVSMAAVGCTEVSHLSRTESDEQDSNYYVNKL